MMRGIIERCQIFTDSLHPTPLEKIAHKLHGVSYRPAAIAAVCHQVMENYPESRAELSETCQWLVEVLQ